MTIEISPARRSKRGLSRFAEAETLKQLPPRRVADPPPRSSRLQWSMVRSDRYEVTVAGMTIGFVDVVGAVFVVLVGPRYDRAVEAMQTLLFEAAMDELERSTS